MRYFYIICCLVIGQTVTAQSKLSGRVEDAISKQGVPFANVQLNVQKIGVQAEEDGSFELSFSVTSDTLQISCVGYETKKIPVQGAFKNKSISLVPYVYPLKEVLLTRTTPNSMRLGVDNPSHSVVILAPQDKAKAIGIYIGNNLHPKKQFIDSITFYIDSRLFEVNRAPFRVRLLNCVNGLPGEDILWTNIIVQPSKDTEWQRVNLKDFNIEMPENGVFAVMEFLYGYKRKYFYKSTNFTTGEKIKKYGSGIGLSPDFPTAKTVILPKDGNWQPKEIKIPQFSKLNYSPMIYINVSVYD